MSSVKRIQKELGELIKNPIANISLDTIDTITKWTGLLIGPDGSVYAGGLFRFEITFPAEYPFKAPVFKFITRVYHPNVDSSGSICLGVLKQDCWKPATQMKVVLQSIVNLLVEPNADDPLETDIAELFKTNHDKFAQTAREWTEKYAK